MSRLATVNYTVTPYDFEKTPAPKELPLMRETDAAGYVARVGHESPVWTGTVNVESVPGGKKTFGGVWLYVLLYRDGTGVACGRDPWASEVSPKFYAFGCIHSYRELSTRECRTRGLYHAGNCYHVSECRSCGHILTVDSSD